MGRATFTGTTGDKMTKNKHEDREKKEELIKRNLNR